VPRAFLTLLLIAAARPVAPTDRPVTHYLTAPQPNGVVGGERAQQIAASLADALRRRGADAQPDGALAATAQWYLREKGAGLSQGSGECEQVARRHGFAGNVMGAATAGRDFERLWRDTLADVPANVPVTRYGVHVSADGLATVVIGSMEATLGPIPRHLAPGQTVRLNGEIARRFARASVYLMRTDGKVDETAVPSRRIDVSFRLPKAGVYRIEVMGDGPTGPLIVLNVPIYVGVPEPEPTLRKSARGGPATAAEAEARMLVLLNGARARAGLPALAADRELRAIALGHSQDMARAHFVGHVSPTTGTPEDRIKRAGAVLSAGGENISLASGPDEAHEDLMSSPGHRANMLSPTFTHVGIAIVPSGEQILATLVFGRRPSLHAAPWTAQRAVAAIAAVRKARRLEPVPIDPILRAAAEAGVKAFASGGAKAAFAESHAALQREVERSGHERPPACVHSFELLQPDQIGDLPVVVEPLLRRMGLGTTTRTDGKATWLVLLLLTEGVKCR
jgi:uncharacterized protein YkwD